MDSINERRLNHSVEEGRDVLASVTGVTSLDEVGELSVGPSTVGVGELEGVKEGGGGLEVGSAGDQLVDQVLDTDEAVLAQSLLDDRVVVQGDPLSGDLGVTSLVDELLDGLEVGLTVGDVWFDETKHLLGSLGDPDKDTVVDLEQSEELEDLSGLGGDLGDTLDPDDEVDLGLGRDVEVTSLPGLPLQPDLLPLLVSVLLNVLVGTLEDDLSLGLSLLLGLGSLGQLLLPRLLGRPPLLQQGLGDGDLLGGRGGGGDGHSCDVVFFFWWWW